MSEDTHEVNNEGTDTPSAGESFEPEMTQALSEPAGAVEATDAELDKCDGGGPCTGKCGGPDLISKLEVRQQAERCEENDLSHVALFIFAMSEDTPPKAAYAKAKEFVDFQASRKARLDDRHERERRALQEDASDDA